MGSMKYGYARTSKRDQNLESQVATLKRAGCKRIFAEQISSRKWERPEFMKVLEALEPGDSLTVWRLDRAVSSVEQLEKLLSFLETRQVSFISLTEHLDTTTAMGRAMVQMIGVLNQLRLDVIRENTLEGLESARARGVKLGRPYLLSPYQEREVVRLVDEGKAKSDVARLFGVGPSVITRVLQRHRQAQG